MGSGFSESQQEVSERPELKITPVLGTAWMPGGWGGNEVIKGERETEFVKTKNNQAQGLGQDS